MSALYTKIQELRTQARLAKNAEQISFYTSLVGDIENKGKDKGSKGITDQLILNLLKSLRDNLNKFKSDCAEKNITIPEEKSKSIEFEIGLISSLLPQLISTEELESAIHGFFHSTRLATQPFNVPWVMGYLNGRFPNRFDRAMAADIVKTKYENIPITTYEDREALRASKQVQ